MTDLNAHIFEDDLVLLFYGELPDDRHASVTEHLAGCPACRESYHLLTRTLHMAGTVQAPDPGPDFETRVWARLAPALTAPPASRSGSMKILALAAAIVVVAGGGWWMADRLSPEPVPRMTDHTPASELRERVLLSAVDVHLVQTEMLFVELLNAPADEPAASGYARDTADDLVASGRLYRETARETGDTALVAAFDELEPVLIEVARSTDATTATDFGALRGRIEQDDLLFKVRALAADVQDRQSRTASGEGAL